MPTIVFTDGSRKKVDYDTGATIFQVLEGNKKPTKKQAEYCIKVVTVEFEARKVVVPAGERRVVQRDDKLRHIMADKSIKGYKKFQAIGRHMKERAGNDEED